MHHASPVALAERGIRRDGLEDGRRICRDLTRAHGTTYYWGTVFLPPQQRHDVYGVYALCRLADDIVDEPDAPHLVDLDVPAGASPAQRLEAFAERFYAEWEHGTDPHPAMQAIGDTVRRLDLPRDCFERFFGAMSLDLTRTRWASWEELRDVYMEGSAAVIGEMMLPVLRPLTPAAKEPARALGLAFQLTNFIRDVGEDLDRGRVYLPADELEFYGADPWARRVTPAWREFLAAQIARNRELYAQAEPGVRMLPPAAARCVGAALAMYSTILTRIEQADYDVFTDRRRVHPAAKTALAASVLVTGRGRTAAPAPTAPVASTSAPPAGAHRTGPREDDEVTSTLRTPDTTETAAPGPTGPPSRPREPSSPSAPAVRTRQAVAERIPIRRVPQPPPEVIRSTWRQAAVPRIERALRLAQRRDPGGWYVVGASTDLRTGTSIVRTVNGREIALWRADDGRLLAGPGACPHMGARLAGCDVAGSDLMCRWHGLRLPSEWPGDWRTMPAHDDGALLWVRLATPGEEPTDSPALPARPALRESLTSVYAKSARCEPVDIIANRLDPWHGAWFHPYAFSHLIVDDDASTDECLVTDVTFRLNHTWGVPVRAQFTCPDARTIVMHIVQGEGAGSVVETHTTPLGTDAAGHPVTVMTEATIASSPRPGFRVAQAFSPLIRPLMVRTQAQLWIDDLEYAQRRYLVRSGQVPL